MLVGIGNVPGRYGFRDWSVLLLEKGSLSFSNGRVVGLAEPDALISTFQSMPSSSPLSSLASITFASIVT